MEKRIYFKEFGCGNCGERFRKEFDFGEVAEKGCCPKCGVTDMQLLANGTRNNLSTEAVLDVERFHKGDKK